MPRSAHRRLTANAESVEMTYLSCERGWFSGRIVPCHGTDPGSIPGSRMNFYFADTAADFVRAVGLFIYSNSRLPFSQFFFSKNAIA